MRFFPLLISMTFLGCQYDPHAHLLTTAKPSPEDVIGVYVVDRFDLPKKELAGQGAEITVELRADGTFVATNVPPQDLNLPKGNFFTTLISGTGLWEIGQMGRLDGEHTLWGIYLRDPDNKMLPANLTGKKPPYGLLFQLGDPDSGFAILVKKQS